MNENQPLSLAIRNFLDGLAELIAERLREEFGQDQARVEKESATPSTEKDAAKPTRLLTADEVARFMRVPRARVYELVAQRKIPAVRVGRLIRIPEDILQAWVSKRRGFALGAEPSPYSWLAK